MLSNVFFKLTMVGVALAVVCWIGWSVPAPNSPDPLEPAEHQEHGRYTLEPTAPPSMKSTPSAPHERPRDHDVLRRAAGIALDLNRASAQDFERLPGIGPVLAGRIIQYRASQGMFHDIEQLREVKGIGPKKFEQIRAHVAVAPAAIPKAARKTA
ncbi:MAG TPA: helix-hairpin-helix domain-containing protein [Nitrospira sp.]|nr:helix-hairpin-helix domain-containing protein [Nitrospira sp.]